MDFRFLGYQIVSVVVLNFENMILWDFEFIFWGGWSVLMIIKIKMFIDLRQNIVYRKEGKVGLKLIVIFKIQGYFRFILILGNLKIQGYLGLFRFWGSKIGFLIDKWLEFMFKFSREQLKY